MKKVLVGLLMVIPLIIVGAVLLVTEVILLTPDVAVSGVEIVDEYQLKLDYIEVENYSPGIQYTLYAKVSPSRANNKKVSWSIDSVQQFNDDFKGEIATVSESGVVTINSSGTFDVVVTTDDGGYTARCSFRVNSDVATSAYIVYNGQRTDEINNALTIRDDQIVKLDACARPTDVDIENISWTALSADGITPSDVVKVDQNGVVTPLKTGSATVKMTIKSFDKYDAEGVLKKAAPVLTQTINITVGDGVFNAPYYNFCSDDELPAVLPLSTLDAEGATLAEGSDGTDFVEIVGGNLVFKSNNVKAVLSKGGSSIIVRKYRQNDVTFENFDYLNEKTIIIGKIPYALKCVYANSGEEVVGATYTSEFPEYATIGQSDGKITALKEPISSTPVRFSAGAGAGVQNCVITMYVKEAVLFFKLRTDTVLGIARERIYGSKWYDFNLDVTTTREQLEIIQPKGISNARFDWSVDEANRDVVSIDDMGVITVADGFFEERLVTVTIAAKESPYTCDRIHSTYTFKLRPGINVTDQREIEAAAAKSEEIYNRIHTDGEDIDIRLYDIYLQGKENDIQYRDEILLFDTNQSWHLNVYASVYGNGNTLYWRYRGADDAKNIEGADIIAMRGDDIVLSNIKIESSMLPSDGTYTSSSFSRKCVETFGTNVRVEYCLLENAQYCSQVSSLNVTYEGCVFRNSSKFSLFCWAVRENQYCKVKNCLFGQSAAPSVGFSAGDKDPSHSCTLELEGFCHIYNWKQMMDMDLIGSITGDQAIDGTIRSVVNEELSSGKYEDYFVQKNGLTYMHCGIMLNGFERPQNTTLTGNLEENGYKTFTIDIGQLGDGIVAELFNDGLYDITFYGYYDGDYPVEPDAAFPSLNEETCKMLREGLPPEAQEE